MKLRIMYPKVHTYTNGEVSVDADNAAVDMCSYTKALDLTDSYYEGLDRGTCVEKRGPSPNHQHVADGTSEDRSRQKKIIFTNVEVIEHPICIGDHPSVSRGCPIQLDYSIQPIRETFDITLFEIQRSTERKVGRKNKLRLKSDQREKILDSMFIPREERREAEEKVKAIKWQRAHTLLLHRIKRAPWKLFATKNLISYIRQRC